MKTYTVPAGLTAEQIIKSCNNKTSKDTPVLWSTSWHENETFYTQEKTRGGTYEVDELAHKGKSWNECAEIATGTRIPQKPLASCWRI